MRKSRSLITSGMALTVSCRIDLRALQQHAGNVSAAAQALGISGDAIYHN